MSRQAELERLARKAEKALDKEVFGFYKQALMDLKREAKKYIDQYEELTPQKQMELARLLRKSKAIENIIRGMADNVQLHINDFLTNKAIDGYLGALYEVEGKIDVGLQFDMISEQYVKKLVNKKTVGKDFSKRLYQRTVQMGKVVKNELLNGAVSGKGYKRIAKNISEQIEATYKQSLRIARTEGKRIQSTTTQAGYEEAQDLGVSMMKEWSATLAETTRDEHQELDGQRVGIEEMFEVDGYEAEGPGLFGEPEMDCNCMCSTITIIEGISPQLRRDQETKEVMPYKNYAEWKEDRG